MHQLSYPTDNGRNLALPPNFAQSVAGSKPLSRRLSSLGKMPAGLSHCESPLPRRRAAMTGLTTIRPS
jgi:hypothetical protein